VLSQPSALFYIQAEIRYFIKSIRSLTYAAVRASEARQTLALVMVDAVNAGSFVVAVNETEEQH